MAVPGRLRAPGEQAHRVLDLPQFTGDIFAAVPAAFIEEQGFDGRKRLILVLDGARRHTSDRVRVPPGATLIVQPPYSPELQPRSGSGRSATMGEVHHRSDVVEFRRELYSEWLTRRRTSEDATER